MKRFWIGILLLFLSITLCVVEQRLTVAMSQDVINYLDSATEAAENNNYNLAVNLNGQLKSSWKKFKKPLAIFVSHDILNDVTESLSIFEAQLSEEDIFLNTNYAKVKTQISSIEENGKFLIENIF